jgi:hypothetical protein
LNDEIELRFGGCDEDELDGDAAHCGCNGRTRRRGVIDRAAEQRLHADRAADHDHFDIESFVTIEALHLSDPKRHLGDGSGADGESNFFELGRNRRRGGNGEN